MKTKLMCAAIGAALMAASGAASAATATTTLPVTATVLATCLVVAAPLVFGNYTGVQLDANAVLTVTCTAGTTYNVGLDAGAGTGATTTVRKMSFGTNTLNYALYRDAAHTLNWGNTVATDTVPGTGALLPVLHTVYGRIPASQSPSAGAYLDTVGVTVTY